MTTNTRWTFPALICALFGLFAILYSAHVRAEEVKGMAPKQDTDTSGIWAPTQNTKLLFVEAPETAVLNIATNTDVTFYDGSESLRIVGLLKRSEPPADYPKDKVWFYSHDHYSRPEKPEDVKVILTTKDGRKWNAKWEEAK